jgi:hypothetical protein
MWIRRPSELAYAVCLVFVIPRGDAALAAPSQDDAIAEYRERFKQGMDRYLQGAPAEAIGLWLPIYRELGPEKGYRLAYDLGVSYAELGDATHAAEHLLVFVNGVDARRARGEALGAMVTKEEADARARLSALEASRGRIRVAAGRAPRAVQVDASEPRLAGFVAWVAPGQHTVTFGPGTPEAQSESVDVEAGKVVDLAPPEPPQAAARAGTAQEGPAARGAEPLAGPAAQAHPSSPRVPNRSPFSPAAIAITGATAVGATIASVLLEAYTQSLRSRFVAEQAQSPTHSIPETDRTSFDASRTWTYATVGLAAACAATTAGLGAWYLLARPDREPAVVPSAAAARSGATLVVQGQF